jgi:hypothetical protein
VGHVEDDCGVLVALPNLEGLIHKANLGRIYGCHVAHTEDPLGGDSRRNPRMGGSRIVEVHPSAFKQGSLAPTPTALAPLPLLSSILDI